MGEAVEAGVSCRHERLVESCPLCRVHHGVNSLGTGPREGPFHLPDEVIVLEGGRYFHVRESCRHLGREIARRQGSGLTISISVRTPSQAIADRFTNCSGCLAEEDLVSVIGFAAETVAERRKRLKIRPRDFGDLKALALTDEEALDWWELGFTPSQVAQLLRNGVEFKTVLDEWLKSENANAAFRTLRSSGN